MRRFLSLFFVFLLFASPVYAKDYSIPKVNIEVTLNKDGSADITEERTYSFSDTFHWAGQYIPLQNHKLIFKSLTSGNITYRPDEELSYQESARSKARLIQNIAYVLSFVGILVSVGIILRLFYWVYLWWKFGRDPWLKKVNDAGALYDPPSDLPPAMVNALSDPFFEIDGNAITATILDLCRRKVLKIE